MHRIVAVFIAASCLGSSPAAAQHVPCRGGPCVGKARRATHFIAALSGGTTLDAGLAFGATVGVGGKLRGFPLRFYAVVDAGYATWSTQGSTAGGAIGFRDDRSAYDIGGGLRIYVPVVGRFRLFGDAIVGGTRSDARLVREGFRTRAAGGWSASFATGGGAQFRLMRALSLGLRVKAVLTDSDVGGLHAAVGSDAPVRTSITAGLTWHF